MKHTLILAILLLSTGLGGCGWLESLIGEDEFKPVLLSITPANGKPGETLVTVKGEMISNPLRDDQAVLYFDGIALALDTEGAQTGVQKWDPDAKEIQFIVPSGAKNGVYDVYITTEFGESNALKFTVGDIVKPVGVPQKVVGWVLHDNASQAMVFQVEADLNDEQQWNLSTNLLTDSVDGTASQLVELASDGQEVEARDVLVDSERKRSWVALSTFSDDGETHVVRPFTTNYLTRSTDVEVGVNPSQLAIGSAWSTLWALGQGDDSLTGIVARGEDTGKLKWKAYLHDLDRFMAPENLIATSLGLVVLGNDRGTAKGSLVAARLSSSFRDVKREQFSGYRLSGAFAVNAQDHSLYVGAVALDGTDRGAILRLSMSALTDVTSVASSIETELLLKAGETVSDLAVIPVAPSSLDYRLWVGVEGGANGNDSVRGILAGAIVPGVIDLSLPLLGPAPGGSTTVTVGDARVGIMWSEGITSAGTDIALNFTLEPEPGNYYFDITASAPVFGASNVTTVSMLAPSTTASVVFQANKIEDLAFDVAITTDPANGSVGETHIVVEAAKPLVHRFDTPAQVDGPRSLYWIKKTPFMLVSNHELDQIAVFKIWDVPAYDHSFPSFASGPTVIYCGQEDK